VGVAGDQRDPGKAAGDQVSAERQPAGAVLGGGDLQTEDLPVSRRVDPGGDQSVDVDRSPGLTHLQDQRVGRDEGVGPGV